MSKTKNKRISNHVITVTVVTVIRSCMESRCIAGNTSSKAIVFIDGVQIYNSYKAIAMAVVEC